MNRIARCLGLLLLLAAVPSAAWAEGLHAYDEIYLVIASALAFLVALLLGAAVLLRNTRVHGVLLWSLPILYLAATWFAFPLVRSTIADLLWHSPNPALPAIHVFAGLFLAASVGMAVAWTHLLRRWLQRAA